MFAQANLSCSVCQSIDQTPSSPVAVPSGHMIMKCTCASVKAVFASVTKCGVFLMHSWFCALDLLSRGCLQYLSDLFENITAGMSTGGGVGFFKRTCSNAPRSTAASACILETQNQECWCALDGAPGDLC